MSRRTRWLLVLAVAVLALGLAALRTLEQRRRAAAAWPTVSAAGGPAASAGTVGSTGTGLQAVDLLERDFVRVQPRELSRTVAVSGGIQALNTALVKAKVAAELRELGVREGDTVRAGQVLGHLDATEYQWRLRQAEDQAAAAQAQLDIAERTLANHRALVEQGFISRNALDTAVSNAAAARAALQAARAGAELARKALADTELRAPLGGQVSQRLAQTGERVGVDGRIVEIVDLTQLELQAAIPAEEIAAVRVGQTARLQVEGLAQPLAARVVRINPAAQSGTRAVTTYLRLAAAPALRQGLFARGHIEIDRQRVLAVPAAALRTERSRPHVLVAQDGRVAVREPVLGLRGEADFGAGPEPAVQVLQGLPEGSAVLRASVGNLPAGARLQLPAAAAARAAAAASGAASGSP